MLGVFADNHDFAFSLDDLAFLADLLNGWFYLHCSTIPFLLYLDSASLDPTFSRIGLISRAR